MNKDIMRKGSNGDTVKALQGKLVTLGFELTPDGIFGDRTEHAVRELQTLFGYDVDGLVGKGTTGLIEAQVGYGWNYKAPDAKGRALAAQGKNVVATGPVAMGPKAVPPSTAQTKAKPVMAPKS